MTNDKTTILYKFAYFPFISEDLYKKWKGTNDSDQDCITNLWNSYIWCEKSWPCILSNMIFVN